MSFFFNFFVEKIYSRTVSFLPPIPAASTCPLHRGTNTVPGRERRTGSDGARWWRRRAACECEVFRDRRKNKEKITYVSFFFLSSGVSRLLLASATSLARSCLFVCVRACSGEPGGRSRPGVSSHFSLEVALGRVRCVGGGRVPVLIVQLHALLLLPRHDGQLGGHVLEVVPGALALWVGLVLAEEAEMEGERKEDSSMR